MNGVLEKISSDYKLNDNDLYIAKYIIDHSDEVAQLSTHQLARKTYIIATTIVKFVKKPDFTSHNKF